MHRVLVVDDVVTTGGSLMRAVDALRMQGSEVVGTAALVDRGGGARAVQARGPGYVSALDFADIEEG